VDEVNVSGGEVAASGCPAFCANAKAIGEIRPKRAIGEHDVF